MTNTKITYTQQGDYLLPDLKLPEQPKVEIGIFGKRHLRYLERNRKILYTNMLTKGKLTAYLADIDEQAENMFDQLVRQLAEREGVTEQLKANNQMLWVKKMNSIRNRERKSLITSSFTAKSRAAELNILGGYLSLKPKKPLL